MEYLNLNSVQDKIIEIGNQRVILDSDVAELYSVETKRVNEAVGNNPDKFPDGYIIEVTAENWNSLRSKFSTLNTEGRGKHTKYIPKAFTEKGLFTVT
jgi:hypothetical protein